MAELTSVKRYSKFKMASMFKGKTTENNKNFIKNYRTLVSDSFLEKKGLLEYNCVYNLNEIKVLSKKELLIKMQNFLNYYIVFRDFGYIYTKYQ